MELRGITLFLALFLIAALQCSGTCDIPDVRDKINFKKSQQTNARTHSIQSRSTKQELADDLDYDTQNDAAGDEDTQNDAAADDETQNDADIGDDEDEDVDAEITNKGEDFHISIGRSVRLPCIIEPSPKENKAIVFQWLKDGNIYFLGTQKLNVPDRISIDKETGNYLLINDVQPEDSGRYKCMITKERTHAAEKPNYIEHIVRVEAAPRILEVSASNRGLVHEGTDVQITCNVSGSPPPKLIWSRESASGSNEGLTEQDAEFSTNSVLIRNIRREQAGKYLCYADNKVGNPVVGSVNVKVLGKPRVHVHKTVVNSGFNVEAVLECSAHEEPPASIRWYKDRTPISDSDRKYPVTVSGQHSTLKFTPTDDEDFGVFTCEAENDFGKHNRSIALVQTPVVEDLETDGPKLTWRVHSHQPLQEIQLQLRELNGNGIERTISVPVPTNPAHEFEIVYVLDEKDLNPGKYEALVNVRNNVDWGRKIEPAVIEIDSQPLIQGASVYRAGSNAHTTLPATSLLATISMYLFFRMV